MVNYNCECCSFNSDRKSSYDNHLKSNKHLNKIKGISTTMSDTSSITSQTMTANICDNSSLSRIRELEHKIMLMKTEYELKLQVKDEMLNHKEEIIAMLKQQLQK